MGEHHVVVRFGSGITADVQGVCLLWLERYMREEHKIPAEVFKETMPDDSKLRSRMTPLERAKL